MIGKTVGTCSICNGPGVTPLTWLGINPPIPTCSVCGATKKEHYGKTIEMEPNEKNEMINKMKVENKKC